MKNRLRVLRADRGWSQAQLAAALGVSRQTVRFVETGRYDPSLPLAFRIGRVFRSTIEAIFTPDESGSPPPIGINPRAGATRDASAPTP